MLEMSLYGFRPHGLMRVAVSTLSTGPYLQQHDGLKFMVTPSWTAHLICVLPQTTLKILSSWG